VNLGIIAVIADVIDTLLVHAKGKKMGKETGIIWDETPEPKSYIYKKNEEKITPTQGKNHCPNCGGSNLTLRTIPVFGSPGHLIKATCRDCGMVF
jgi:hypothetical protein